MQWSSAAEFFSMGGYGFYVWGSYGVTLVLLGLEVLMLMKRTRQAVKKTRNSKLETRNSGL